VTEWAGWLRSRPPLLETRSLRPHDTRNDDRREGGRLTAIDVGSRRFQWALDRFSRSGAPED
jgi:hypothetical protein